MSRVSAEARFLAKVVVDEATDCWMWIGGKTKPYGYAQFYYDGSMRVAVRWAYAHWVGPIPDGMELDHYICERPSCVNPWHVRPASHRENTLRGNAVSSRALAATHCPQGHEYSEENMYRLKDGRRQCKPCGRNIDRRRRGKAMA